MQEKEANSLAYNHYRDENVIRHSPESYVEVSIRSIQKIRMYEKSTKNNTSKKTSIALAIWTACLGAILGYIPDIINMVQTRKIRGSLAIYALVLIVGIVFFFRWRELERDDSSQLNAIRDLIHDEFSEDRIPTNQRVTSNTNNSITIDSTNTVINEYNSAPKN